MTENKSIRAGIIGAAGYTGGELIRLLVRHPYVSVSSVVIKSQEGKHVAELHQDLIGETDLVFSSALKDVDVIFLCAGHGEAIKWLSSNHVDANTKVIDLSNDFRLSANQSINGRRFIYGLPEMNRDEIVTAKSIANPGCFATAIQLGLFPLAEAGLLDKIYATGITGSTGAGQSLSETSHFSWRANNIQPYKTLSHQHLSEIGESLEHLKPENGNNIKLNFVPWRGDFTRGIFISSQLECDWSLQKLKDHFKSFYNGHPFTTVSDTPIHLKQVVNTNKCLIHLEKVDDTLVVHSAIDNLLKGASGQAVQNMNLMFGIDECAGLALKASAF